MARPTESLATALPAQEVRAALDALIGGDSIETVLRRCGEAKPKMLGLIASVDALRAKERDAGVKLVVASSHPDDGGSFEIDLPALLLRETSPLPADPLPRNEAPPKSPSSLKRTCLFPTPRPATASLSSVSLVEACALLGIPEQLVVAGAGRAALSRAEAATASAAATVAAASEQASAATETEAATVAEPPEEPSSDPLAAGAALAVTPVSRSVHVTPQSGRRGADDDLLPPPPGSVHTTKRSRYAPARTSADAGGDCHGRKRRL